MLLCSSWRCFKLTQRALTDIQLLVEQLKEPWLLAPLLGPQVCSTSNNISVSVVQRSLKQRQLEQNNTFTESHFSKSERK